MKTPCKQPGCRALLDKSGYCPAHQSSKPNHQTNYNKHVRAKDPALALANKIRKSAKWLRIRNQFLAEHPLCSDPFGDHARRGTSETSCQVHHRHGLRTNPELWNHIDNLQPVCARCHSRLERMAQTATDDDATPPAPSSDDWKPFG